MESLQKPIFDSLKRYWRRRQYQRLHGKVVNGRKNAKVIRIGGGSPRFWRVKANSKVSWKIASPLKLMTKLKNGYMNMMIGLAGNVGYLNTHNIFGGKRIPKARKLPLGYSNYEFDGRLVYEICKALDATRELSLP